MHDPASLAVAPGRAAVVIVDIQDRLAAAMPEEALALAERNVATLVELARRLEMPVVVSEQYPRGLGKTRAPIEEALATIGDRVRRLEKLDFGVCAADAFRPVWDELGGERTQWIVTGMESHVCVYQSVRQLCARGHTVFVPQDAVVSRARHNWRVGLELMGRAGAVVTSTETVVFDALGRAGTDDFKALSRLIR